MKEIVLTQGKVAFVDDEDFERINQYKWFAQNPARDNLWYALRNIIINGKRIMMQMHRYICNL